MHVFHRSNLCCFKICHYPLFTGRWMSGPAEFRGYKIWPNWICNWIALLYIDHCSSCPVNSHSTSMAINQIIQQLHLCGGSGRCRVERDHYGYTGGLGIDWISKSFTWETILEFHKGIVIHATAINHSG